jgi:hypothetical protein
VSGLDHIDLATLQIIGSKVAWIATEPSQMSVIGRLRERKLIYAVRDPLFGETWHLTKAGRAVLEDLE